jgi:hypothetical protein
MSQGEPPAKPSRTAAWFRIVLSMAVAQLIGLAVPCVVAWVLGAGLCGAPSGVIMFSAWLCGAVAMFWRFSREFGI